MTFQKFTTDEKVKIFNKMLKQVNKMITYSTEDSLSDDLYYACKVAGGMFEEEIFKKVEMK